MRFDDDLWKKAEQAAQQTRRSTTKYIEYAVQEQIKRDIASGTIKVPGK